jgi:hypothetical protein
MAGDDIRGEEKSKEKRGKKEKNKEERDREQDGRRRERLQGLCFMKSIRQGVYDIHHPDDIHMR